MKKILVLIFFGFILSGCATYKFQQPATSGAQGYLACYDGKPILEYTVGQEKSLPDLALAKERFKRRRRTVEDYYKQMNLIETRLKKFIWDPPAMLVDLLGGILRWPFVAIADYKYNRNIQYKEKVDRLDEQREELEKVRVSALKKKLAAYIIEDLNKEEGILPGTVATAPVVEEPALIQEPLPQALPVAQEIAPQEETFVPQEETPASQEIVTSASAVVPISVPVVIIMAKPVKGNSPLIVKFSGQKSYSRSRKIVAYDWDFGDGDTSTKKNPENTYWSTTFGPRNFTATLTVRDDAGNTASASTIIKVIN